MKIEEIIERINEAERLIRRKCYARAGNILSKLQKRIKEGLR